MVRGRPLLDLLRKHSGGMGAALVTVALVVSGSLENLEHWSLGQLFELRGEKTPKVPVVIVTLDESTFAELHTQWPFPRAMHGELLDKISAGKPRVIGVDLLFDTPSARGPEDDATLSEAIARASNVVLGAAWALDVQPGIVRATCNFPLPAIRERAAAVAPVNLFPDDDGSIRRVPLGFKCGDERMPGFAVQLHRLAAASGLPTASLPAPPNALINFRGGPRTYQWVAYYRVIRDEVKPEIFRDKIVLVGPTSEVLHDVYPTAFARDGTMPGVEIQANAVETLIRGNPIREVPRWASTVLAVLAALIGSVLVVRLRAPRALMAAVLVWVTLAVIAFVVFQTADVWMRGMAGSLALVLGYGVTVIENLVREQREKRRLSQFFSPEVLREVVRHRDDNSLGSRRRLVTVLFSDIRGFTSISEKLRPEDVADMLQEYLTEMTEIVFRHGGAVDKYIGDCVMALYNAPFEDPEHAINAVRTGLEFQERALAVSARWEQKFGVRIRNGVGINTGEAVVGTLGSRQRLEYTAIGDTVNLASRLESITKEYGVSIIISEFTHELVKDRFTTRELDDVTVKGKSEPVKIYAVVPASTRKHPRALLDSAATLVATGDGRVCHVRTIDVSEGGLALSGVPPEWKKGTKIQVRCEGGLLPKPIVADGTIVWRRGASVGIAFSALDTESAPALADYVANQGPGPASS